MGTVNEIPLVSRAQRFQVTLAGVTWSLRVRWCPPALAWVLDISDANDNLVVGGIPLVTGADLLGQYAYLGIGGSLYVQSDDAVDNVPTLGNLGSISHLYFVTT